MIGILFATSFEAKPFLIRTKARQISERPFPVYSSNLPTDKTGCVTVISGIGKVVAALATQALICEHKVDVVVNAGICGALAEDFEPGTVFRVIRTWEGDRGELGATTSPLICSYDLWLDLKGARLITNDTPVFDSKKKRLLAQSGDLVDMEGAAVVKTAMMYGTTCHLLKGVTDSADAEGQKTLRKNCKKVSERLAYVLIDGLPELQTMSGEKTGHKG